MKITNTYPILAREGWGILLGSVAIAIIFSRFVPWLALPAWLFVLFATQFFRDPVRAAAGDDKDISSPADGRIVFIGEVEDPLLKTPAIKVSVFMNVFNVHSNKAPTAGTITHREYHAGQFLNAALDKASDANERCGLTVKRADGVNVTFVQIAGLIARRILNYANIGDTVAKGDRYGFIRFGSRVDVYLPLDAQIRVAIGEKVSNNATVLARLA